MAADVLATEGNKGISNHDTDLVKPSPRTLRVNDNWLWNRNIEV